MLDNFKTSYKAGEFSSYIKVVDKKREENTARPVIVFSTPVSNKIRWIPTIRTDMFGQVATTARKNNSHQVLVNSGSHSRSG